MARLTIEQVAAPDLSDTSRILANAGQSLREGISSASDLLAKYQEGQMAKADNAILGELASLSSEEELNKYLATNPLMGRNFSPAMQENLLGLRDRVLGYGQSRADISNTDARTANTHALTDNTRATTQINLAAEGRTADTYADNVATRDALRATTGDVLRAHREGMQYGTAGVPAPGVGPLNEREMLARTIAAEAGGESLEGQIAVGSVIRNRLASGQYGETLQDVILAPGQFSAWNSETGYAGGKGGLDMKNIKVTDDNYAAADRILSGDYQDVTNGALNYYNPKDANPVWGAGAGGVWRPIGNHIFGVAGSGSGVQGNTGPIAISGSAPGAAPVPGGNRPTEITQNTANNPAIDALYDSLIASTQFDPDTALAMLNSALTGQSEGQSRIDAAEAEAAATRSATALLRTVQDPNILTGEDAAVRARQIAEGNSANPQEAVAQMASLLSATGEGGALSGALSAGATGLNPEANALVDLANQQIQDEIDRDPFLQATSGAMEYSNADPAESLAADLEAMGAQGMVPADMRGKINSLARELGIEPAEAAYAFKMAAETAWNQNFLVGADGWITFFGDGLANTKAKELAQEYFGGDKTNAAKRRILDAQTKQKQISTLRDEAEKAAKKLSKAGSNAPAAYRQEFEAAAKALEEAVRAR